MKKKAVTLLCLIVVFPLLLLLGVRCIGHAIAAAADWIVEGRAWSKFLIARAEAIERCFSVDAKSEHEAWKARMRERGEFK